MIASLWQGLPVKKKVKKNHLKVICKKLVWLQEGWQSTEDWCRIKLYHMKWKRELLYIAGCCAGITPECWAGFSSFGAAPQNTSLYPVPGKLGEQSVCYSCITNRLKNSKENKVQEWKEKVQLPGKLFHNTLKAYQLTHLYSYPKPGSSGTEHRRRHSASTRNCTPSLKETPAAIPIHPSPSVLWTKGMRVLALKADECLQGVCISHLLYHIVII